MNHEIVILPEIAIIGKEGLCTIDHNIAKDLWKEANAHFNEVAHLGMKEQNGSFVGFWGAMSDETMSYLPWKENFTRGYYLAGLEVYKDTLAPEGWTKWIMPARTYLKVQIETDQYSHIFKHMITVLLPEMKLKLSGAVCEYIEPATRKNFLLFPVINKDLF